MALEFDIKTPDDSFEKWAKDAADAINGMAAAQKKSNAQSEKIGKTEKLSGTHVKKALVDHKKTTVEEAKQKKSVVDLAASWYLIKDAARFAYDSVIGLGRSVLEIAYNAERSRTGAKAMMDIFTNGHGAAELEYLDKQARKLGQSVEDVRADFIKFSEAGLTNTMADNLIKLKADLGAVGVSGAAAEYAMKGVLDAGADQAQAANMYGQTIARLKETHKGQKGWQDIGSGAMAAAYAAHSYEAAVNGLKDAATEKLADLWRSVGPNIGMAARALSDFLIKSPLVKDAMKGVADAIKDMAKAFNKENLSAALGAMQKTAEGVRDSFLAAAQAYKVLSGDKTATKAAKETLVDDLQRMNPFSDVARKEYAEFQEQRKIAKGELPAPNAAPKFTGGQVGASAPMTMEGSNAEPKKYTGPSTVGNTTINVYVQGDGKNAKEQGRTIGQELQLRLQAGALQFGGG